MINETITTDRSPPSRATLIFLTAISVLTLNLFLPSLPSMAKDFGVSYGAMSAAISSYLFLSALFSLVLGPLADSFGRRPVLLITFGIFTLASACAAITENYTLFLFFRMIQAVCVTGSTLSRAIVRDMYPPGRGTSVLGHIAMAMSVAPLIGPMLGGVLDETLGWRSVFWLFTLMGALSFVMIWIDLGETAKGMGRGVREHMKGYRQVIRSQAFWMYTLVIGSSISAFFTFLSGAPLVASVVFDMAPSSVGIVMGATAFGFFFGSFAAVRLAEKISLGAMMIFGRLIALVGPLTALVLVLTDFIGPLSFFGLMITIGIGNGLSLPSANTGVMSVRPDLSASASGASGAIGIAMGAFGSAVTGALLTPQNSEWLLCALLSFICLSGIVFAILAARAQNDT